MAVQVCLKQGSPSYDVCTSYYSPSASDTCETIRGYARPSLSVVDFFALNPNIDCDALTGTQVGGVDSGGGIAQGKVQG